MRKTKFKIGTRGSKLALFQAGKVLDKLRSAFPESSFEIEVIKTQGDAASPRSVLEDPGLFTKEIEQALDRGRIDLAVHSAKDLPTNLLPSLEMGAVLEREDVRDAWVSAAKIPLVQLKKGGVVATGSPRRKSQLLRFRPDLKVIEIRGNVPTRISKMREGASDGLILAACGLMRLGMENEITERLDKDVMLPAVSQGAIAVEIRKSDSGMGFVRKSLNHAESFLRVEAERALLAALRGGCRVPVGAWSSVQDGRMYLEAAIFSADGGRHVSGSVSGPGEAACRLGQKLAEKLMEQGGVEILGQFQK